MTIKKDDPHSEAAITHTHTSRSSASNHSNRSSVSYDPNPGLDGVKQASHESL